MRAYDVMSVERIRCIPITAETGVLGVITLRDLLRALIVEEEKNPQRRSRV